MSSQADAVRRCEWQAARNNGVIPRKLALREGLDDEAIRRLVRSRRWTRLHTRAYVVSGAPITWRTHLAAVHASLEGGFAFSHRTAGALHGFEQIKEGEVEIVTHGTPQLKGVTVHRVREPWPRTVHIEGFPVTSAHRTVLDLFAVTHRNLATLALEDALRKKMTTIDRLWDEYVATCRSGRNGCKAFRASLLRRDHRDGTLESRMEAKLWPIVRALPGTPATPQFPVRARGKSYRIDFAYPNIKLGIEAMSVRWHEGEVRSFYDVKRDRHLKLEGWTTVYYSWDDLLSPTLVRDEIIEIRDMLSDFSSEKPAL